MKRRLWYAAIGIVLLTTLDTWLGPKLISWWFTPPVDILFNCKGPIEWALNRFQWSQLAGLVVGAIAGFALSFISRSKPE